MRRYLLGLLLCCLAIQTSCRLGSSYEMSSPTVVENGDGTNSLQIATEVTALVLQGPSFIKVDGCRGPFSVEGRDNQGRSGAVLPSGAQIRIGGLPPGTVMFSDALCATSITDGPVVPNGGATRVEFYLNPVTLGEAQLVASKSGLSDGRFKTTVVAGSPHDAVLSAPRNFSAFRCVAVSIFLRDSHSNRTNAEQNIDFDVSISAFPQAKLYSSSSCSSEIRSVRINAGTSQSDNFYIFASATGDGQINASPNLAGLLSPSKDFTVLNTDAPKLVFSAPGGNHVVHSCLPITVLSQESGGTALNARALLTVALGSNAANFRYFSSLDCTGSAITSVDIPVGQNRVSLSASTDVGPQTVAMTATAPAYNSANLDSRWIAGAPKRIEFFGLSPSALVGDFMPGVARLKDQYGNFAAVDQRTSLMMNRGNASVGNARILAGSCAGPEVTQIHIEVNSDSSSFCLLFTRSGLYSLEGAGTGLTSAFADVNIGPQAGPANNMAIDTAANTTAGVCTPFTLKTLDAFGNLHPVSVASPFRIESPSSTVRFFSGTGAPCSDERSILNIPSGGSSVSGYYLETKSGAFVMSARRDPPIPVPLSANASSMVNAAGPAKVVWQGVPAFAYPGQAVGPLTLLAKDEFDNPASLSAALVSGLALNTAANTVFSLNDPTFTTTITQATIPVTADKLERIFLRTRSEGSFSLVATPVNNAINPAVEPLNILPPPATTLKLTAGNSSPRAGECVPMGVTLVDSSGNSIVLDPAVISLSSDSPVGGIFRTAADCNANLNPAKVNISAAVPMGQFVVKTTIAGALQIIAALDGTTQTDSVILNVGVGTGRALDLEATGPSQFFVNEAGGAYEVALRDQFGNLVLPPADLAMTVNSTPAGLTATAGSDPASGAPMIRSISGKGIFYLRSAVAGNFSINITSSGVTSSSRNVQVRNLTPTVGGLTPSSGPIAGGTPVTIAGTNFIAGTSVRFENAVCTSIQIVSSTSITCVTPPHAQGVVEVFVTPPFAADGSNPDGYTYIGPAPTLTSISPNKGPEAGGTAVTISGAGFIDVFEVKVGGVNCVNPTVPSSTEIRCTTAAHAPGKVDVVVRNRFSLPATIVQGFQYLKEAPSITTVSPAQGPIAGGTAVSITGSGFDNTAQVDFGGSPCAITNVSATQILCNTGAHAAGMTNLTITMTDTFPGVKNNAFQYLGAAPGITSVTPNIGSYLGGTPVTIAGSGLFAGATVDFGGSACTGVVVSSATSLSCSTTAHDPGLVTVTINNPNSFPGTLAQAFNYLPAGPGVTSITPASGTSAGGTPVTILGSGFVGTPNVYFDNDACLNINRVSATEIRCVTPAHAPYLAQVRVANPGTLYNNVPGGYRFLGAAPQVFSVNPGYGGYQGGTPVTITGAGFAPISTVSFDTSACTGVVVDSPTQIRCVTSAHAAGLVAVSVASQLQMTGTLANAFWYVGNPTLHPPNGNPPGIVPAGGLRGFVTRVTISGYWLAPPAAPPSVTIGGLPCQVIASSAYQVLCDTSPALPNGPHPVTVSHVGGSVTGLTFTVSDISFHPTEALSPLFGPIAGGTRITIKGTGLTNPNGGTEVRLGGIVCPLVSAAATQIVCTTPAHAAGPVSVTVSHSGFAATAPAPFTYVDCDSGFAVVNATAQATFSGSDVANHDAVYNAGYNVPKMYNPYYGGGSGIAYANEPTTRLKACQMRGYSSVVAFAAASWSSAYNNATLRWHAPIGTFDIWNGDWHNSYTSSFTCRGLLNNACIVDKKWIFPGSTPARWHNVKELHCPSFCSQIGYTNVRSVEGFRCVSGEAQAASAYGIINYRKGYWPQQYTPGIGVGANYETLSGNYDSECYHPELQNPYRKAQKHDHDKTDKTFGCYCGR